MIQKLDKFELIRGRSCPRTGVLIGQLGLLDKFFGILDKLVLHHSCCTRNSAQLRGSLKESPQRTVIADPGAFEPGVGQPDLGRIRDLYLSPHLSTQLPVTYKNNFAESPTISTPDNL